MRLERLHTYTRILLATSLMGMLYGCETSRTIDSGPPPVRVDTASQGGEKISLLLSPLTMSVPVGTSQQFQAMITGTADTSVVWTVTSGLGSISSSGLYTAPATITGDSAIAVVRAVAAADSTASATATITIIRPVTGVECDTTNITFAGTIKPIFQNNCVGCHSGPAAPNGVNLTAYAGAKKVADNGKLAGVIQHLPGFSAMPKGGAKLPACKVAQIRAWINRGAPND